MDDSVEAVARRGTKKTVATIPNPAATPANESLRNPGFVQRSAAIAAIR
jgi:hypothetical protein